MIAGGVFALLVVVALVAPFLIPAETYKKFVISQIESNISAEVELSEIRLKILPLPGLNLKGLKVSNSSGNFAGQNVVAADEASLSVELSPLFSKKIVATVGLTSPEVYFRTAKSGRTNIDDMLVKPEASRQKNDDDSSSSIESNFSLIRAAHAEDEKQASLAGKSASSDDNGWQVMVSGVEIKNGLLQMIKEGERAQEIRELDVSISDFSPTAKRTKAKIRIAAALLDSKTQNVKADGVVNLSLIDSLASTDELKISYNDIVAKIAFDLDYKTAYNIKKFIVSLGGTKLKVAGSVSKDDKKNASLSIEANPIVVGELKKLAPALSPLEGIASPVAKIAVSGPLSDFDRLAVSGNLSASRVAYADFEISNLKSDFSYAAKKLVLKSLTGALYDGSLAGSGTFSLAGEPAYAADVEIKNVDMVKVPSTKGMLLGRGTVKVKASGRGTDAVAIKKNLTADGSINLVNGDIPSLKLGQKIFGNPAWNILAVAGVGLNQQKLNELKSLDASCRNFNMTFRVANGVITTPDLKWQHEKYRATLKGSVTLDERLNFDGEFALLKPTTALLIGNQTARNILVNRSGELAIPFDVKGSVKDPSVTPDGKYMTSLFTKAVNEIVLKKAAGALGQGAGGAADAGKKILRGIFGK